MHQIKNTEKQINEFKGVILVFDKYVSLLESKVHFLSRQQSPTL